MRPLKLTMQAFGPYREQETVDFTELGSNRVFLIHGDTGAGKTTILDAMVFALYGDTSGGERQASQMRCESAPEALATEVTFDFLLGPKRYRVRRRPAQELTGARGATVAKQAEAAIWDRSGCAEDQEGRLLTTKITETNTVIKDSLGFSCDQFRQVVVLPQGRFRELLSAGSDKREEILRQLFKTTRFRQLEDALTERARAVRRRMDELKAQRDAQLGLVDAADDAELAAFADAAVEELERATARAAEAAAASLAADGSLTAAEAADEARSALTAARTELDRLEAGLEQIRSLNARTESAARADKVQPACDLAVDARRQLAAATDARIVAEEDLAAAREVERVATAVLAVEDGRTTEREAAADALRRLEGLRAVIEAWSDAAVEFEGAQARTASSREAVRTAEEAQSRADQSLAALQERLTVAEAAAAQVEGSRVRLDTARQHEDRCRRLLSARDAVEAAEERHVRCAANETDVLEALKRSESGLADLEARWNTGRAAALAAGLVPGQPCPVCGATDHPAPARADEADISDDDLAAAKEDAETARRALSQAHEATARAELDLTTARVTERAIRQEPGAQPDLSLADAESAVAVCRQELAQLSMQADSGELAGELAAAAQAAATVRAAAKTAVDSLVADERALAVAETRLIERAAAVPEDLRAAGALERAVGRAIEVKKALDDAFVSAQQRFAEAKEKRIGLESAAVAAVEAEARTADRERACAADFVTALGKHAFTGEDQWRRALLPEQERLRLEAEIEAYHGAVHQATGRLHQAELAVANQGEPGDIAALRAAAEAARAANNSAVSRQADARNDVERLAKVTQSLAEIDSRSIAVRSDYDTVGVLAEVATGNNPSRVSFQRWVLGVYLDEVLAGASRKLFAMSKGRYQLLRQREVAGRGRASGLDLAVFDEFSGTSRPAVTLSGGESFLAALALALGLADTVQEHAAGIPLETIFVDEGFGALDSDALELAIDALMELQQGGRLVGVISHVPELRQVIPARLEVRGGSTGSSTRFVVP
jgi:DNA repair protein SbcC/Rad50